MSVPPSPGNASWVSKPTPFCSSPNTTASPAPTSVFTDSVLVLGDQHDEVAEADRGPHGRLGPQQAELAQVERALAHAHLVGVDLLQLGARRRRPVLLADRARRTGCR